MELAYLQSPGKGKKRRNKAEKEKQHSRACRISGIEVHIAAVARNRREVISSDPLSLLLGPGTDVFLD